MMNLRKFNGVAKLNHELQTLDLHVIPRDGTVQNAVRNTKSLSGGERSYSTVSFLISLWSCVDHPFYFLDEYDVFTDDINRHIMTKMLLHEAEQKPDRQYTFLTPQDMSKIDASEMITIHTMADPHTN
jgi:structural maintenance of chromosomes protein 6